MDTQVRVGLRWLVQGVLPWFGAIVLMNQLTAAASGVALEGVVVDQQGKLVPAAKIFYMARPWPEEAPAAVCDAQGRFKLVVADQADRPANERYAGLWAYEPGHFATHLTLDLSKLPPAPVKLVLDPPGDFQLDVVDVRHRPVEGVRVQIVACLPGKKKWNWSQQRSRPPKALMKRLAGVTDRAGRVSLPPLMWEDVEEFELSHPDFGCQHMTWINGNPCTERVVRLYPAEARQGRLVADKPDVVRGVKVWFLTKAEGIIDGKPDVVTTGEVVTDQEGRFTTPRLVAGELAVRVPEIEEAKGEKRDFLPKLTPGRELTLGESGPLELRLEPTVRIQGVVREFGTGRPRANVTLYGYLKYSEGSARWSVCRETKTDSQGRFEFRELPCECVVSLSNGRIAQMFSGFDFTAGSPWRTVNVAKGVKACVVPPLDVVLLHCRMVDEKGKASPYVRPECRWREMPANGRGGEATHIEHRFTPAADAEGRFEMFAEPDGLVQIAVKGYSEFTAQTDWFTVPRQPEVSLPDIVLRPKHPVRDRPLAGRFVDRQGRPVAGVRAFSPFLRVETPNGSETPGPRRGETTSDADGCFQLDGAPAGTFPLFAEEAGFRFHGQWVEPGADRLEVVLTRHGEPPQHVIRSADSDDAIRTARRLIGPWTQRAVPAILQGQSRAERDASELSFALVKLAPYRALQLLANQDLTNQRCRESLREAFTWECDRQLSLWLPAIQDVEWLVNGLRYGRFSPRLPRLSPAGEIIVWADGLPSNAVEEKVAALRTALRHAPPSSAPADRLLCLGWIAERLLDLGRKDEAASLFREGQSLSKALAAGRAEPFRAEFAVQLARFDRAGAEEIAQSLRADLREQATVAMAQILAASQPAESERLTGLLRTLKYGRLDTDRQTRLVCESMAAVDFPRARKLATGIEDPESKARAYVAMAVAVSPQRRDVASDLLREAFAVLREEVCPAMEPQSRRQLVTAAVELLDGVEKVDPALLEEYFWIALSLRLPFVSHEEVDEDIQSLPEWVGSELLLASLLKRYDPPSARQVFAEVWSRLPVGRRAAAAPACLLLDPAAAWAAIDGAEESARCEALWMAGCYLTDGCDPELATPPPLAPMDTAIRLASSYLVTGDYPRPGVSLSTTLEAMDVGDRSPVPILPTPSLCIDGRFSGKPYALGWEETGGKKSNWTNGIDLKQFYYGSDDQYLYLFFRCAPLPAELSRNGESLGRQAELYVMRGTAPAAAPTETTPNTKIIEKADVEIVLSAGAGHSYAVRYEASRREPGRGGFGSSLRTATSSDRDALIAEGPDGVEMAIPLADLALAAGQTCEFVCREYAQRDDDLINRCSIRLKPAGR